MTLRIGVSPFGHTPDGALRVADLAVEGGIDTLWLGDGLLEVADFPQWSGGLESFTHLAWLAGRHPGIRVGVGAAVIPLRDPMWTVRQAATLATLASGGVVLGLCPGFWEREFEFRNLRYADRGDRFEDLIGGVDALLAGRPYDSATLSVPDGARLSPAPPPDAVEVWLAGGRATFDRALAHHKPFQASRTAPAALAPLAREWFDRGGTTLAVRIRLTIDEHLDDTPGDTVDWGSISGSADQIVEALHAYGALGVTDVSIVPGQDDATSLRTVAALVEHVLPQLG